MTEIGTQESISNLFSKATDLMQAAKTLPRGDKRQEMYLTSRRLFEHIIELTEQLDLFSSNESIEDIATENLKYLLAPAYLARVLISADCSSDRLRIYVKAESILAGFLQRMSAYSLESDRIDRLLKEDNSCRLTQTGCSPSLARAMQSRNEKIARYKKIQDTEARLSDLDKLMQSRDSCDEEITREYYLNLLYRSIEEAIENMELEIRPALFLERNRSSQEDGSPPHTATYRRPSTKLPVERKTFTITKDQIQKKVFGIGYPGRPTVTVDEFITQKMETGELAFQKHEQIYGNSLQRYAEQPNLRKDQEEMSDEEHEAKEERDDTAELDRKRHWDEFKDENPRGSGNRHNMG